MAKASETPKDDASWILADGERITVDEWNSRQAPPKDETYIIHHDGKRMPRDKWHKKFGGGS